jgi:hypothetical protein
LKHLPLPGTFHQPAAAMTMTMSTGVFETLSIEVWPQRVNPLSLYLVGWKSLLVLHLQPLLHQLAKAAARKRFNLQLNEHTNRSSKVHHLISLSDSVADLILCSQ